MMESDLDLLRLEAETAQTPTRREWATRLLARIQNLETNRENLTRAYIYPTTPSSHGTDPTEPTS